MDWNRRNLSGAVAHTNNQQYLPQSTSSTVPNMPNHMVSVQSNPYNSGKICEKNTLLKGLLAARSNEEILRFQLSAMSKSAQTTMQISPSSSSLSPQSNAALSCFPSTQNIQNSMMLNPQIPVYQNSVLQTLQQAQSAAMAQQQAQTAAMAQQQAQTAAMAQQQAQTAAMAQQQAQSAAMAQQQAQSAAMAQQQAQTAAMAQQQAQSLQHFDASAYSTREVKKSNKVKQIKQSGGHLKRRSKHTNSNAAGRHNQNDQIKYQSIMPKASYQNPVANGTSGPYVGSYKAMNEKNVPVSTSNYENGQTILSQRILNYQTATHSNALQLQQNINLQRQISSSHSGFSNNSSNVFSSATVGQLPLLPTQSNASNILNVSVNQMFSNPNQNFVAQQPPQFYTVPQDQHSTPPPPYNSKVPNDQRNNIHDLTTFLNVYHDVKLKYFLLNQENNLLREKMQSSSKGNSDSCPVKPPLLSTFLNWTIPANDHMAMQEVSQISTVTSQPLANTTHGVQTSALFENSFSSHTYPSYTGFDSSQINHGSVANCSGQVPASKTLRSQDLQKTSMVSVQANNQNHSGGNSSNGYLSQNGSFISSAQTATSSESCNRVQTKNPLSSTAKEAIQATLGLWKSDSQSSTQNKSGHSEPKPQMVNKTLQATHFLEEIVSCSVNEPNAVTTTQQLERSTPNMLKGIKPHVAVVSPIVQMKDLAHEINQHPKVFPHRENEYFNELNLPLQFRNAPRNGREDVKPKSNMVSSLPYIEQNSETADENLQISGICTLVEGNSLYDSSIAMMFESSLQTEPGLLLVKTDLNGCTSQCSSEDVICGTSQASSVSHTAETCVRREDGASVYGLDIQSGHNLSPSVFNAESNAVSDQLSELLTEFPFGIKNYMSENKIDNTGISSRKLTEKLEPLKSPVPLFDVNKSIMGIDPVDTLTKEMETQKTKLIDQLSVVKEPTSEVPTDEVASEQLEDDCFEVSDSPDGNIHITLMGQDQIPELFPENSPEPVVLNSFEKKSEAPVLDVAASSKNEKADDESASDKELFCCLFSWLTHTNGNAPKCNCKLTELGETEEFINNVSQPPLAIKTEPSTDSIDSSKDGQKPSTNGLDSSIDTCKTKLEIKNEEIYPLTVKYSRLEPAESTLKSKHVNCISHEEIREKLDSSDQSQKELWKSEILTGETVLQSKSQLEDSNGKSKDPFPGCNSNDDDGPQKVEKLIIKTDFLKSRHLLKMKRKYKEMKSLHAEEGCRSVQKINKNKNIDQSVKTLKMDRSVGGKAKNEECKSPIGTVKSPEKNMNRLKDSRRSDKSHSHNQSSSKGKERVKYRPESHFEKVKRVPSVLEYLERKRELCNKRYRPKEDQRDEPVYAEHRILEKSSMDKSGPSLPDKMPRQSTPTKINVKYYNQSGDLNQERRSRSKNIGTNESVHKKDPHPSDSHGKGSLVNKEQEKKIHSNREKIYLAPCDGSRRASNEGISLTRLQIRHSPLNPGYFDRRSSVDSNVYSKESKSETKNKEAPKMLEFKLCPEFVNRSPSSQESKEPKASKEKSKVEGIKSRKEAWCSGVPPRKSRSDGSLEGQGHHSPQSTSSFKWTHKNSSRPVQDSQATFNVFKQKYQEQRSKSLDGSL